MYFAIPPAYGYPDDGEERPPFVLIEPYAYFAARSNATTATCKMRGFKGDFKLTFCTARPPLVSYMCFDATAYQHTAFAAEPQILAAETDGGLVLLRVVFGNHPSAVFFPRSREYLVYDASGPSLQHITHPGGIRFSDDSIAFVRPHGGGSYVLAATSGGFGYTQPSDLYTYHSDTGTWETKKLLLKPSPSNPVQYHSTSKTITMGGGTIAWVDLWNNIILCDVLADHPSLHSLQLPPPILSDNNEVHDGNPRCLRDIALLDDGSFRYVEMEFHVHPGSPPRGDWEVMVWSNKTSTSSSSVKDWVIDYQLNFSDIPEASLPELRVDPGRAQPTFATLHTGMPKLSLQDDGIVYFLSKVFHNDNDHVAWVLAIDMRNRTIHKVDEFCPARTLGLAEGYDTTRISKYLKGTKQKKSEIL